MKKIILIFVFIMTFAAVSGAKNLPPNSNIGMFYHSLKPYGEWIYLDDDLIVWRPAIRNSFWRPYSDGRWVWTRHGWYWDSFEPFGWATFHYGRWFYDDFYGWVWMPDYEWAPAWVEWRYNDDFIGWAPLPPYAYFRIDFGINFSVSWHSHHSWWNFVSYNNFCGRNVNTYLIAPSKVERFFSRTKYRTNYNMRDREIYNGGIDRNFIERKAGTRISEMRITNAESIERIDRSRDKEVFVYRPVDRNERVNLNEISRGERKLNIEHQNVITGKRDVERTSTREIEKRNSPNVNEGGSRGNERIRVTPENENSRKPVIRSERKSDSEGSRVKVEVKENYDGKVERNSNNEISNGRRESSRTISNEVKVKTGNSREKNNKVIRER